MKFYKEIKCGSYSGYQRHYRLGETACDPCKAGAVEYTKDYQKRNPEKIREAKKSSKYKDRRARSKIRRKVRLKGNRTDPYTLQEVLDLYGTICYLCNTEIDMIAPRSCGVEGWEKGLHLDHVIDIQFGGADAIDNVKPTHALCNLKKSSTNARKAPTQDFS